MNAKTETIRPETEPKSVSLQSKYGIATMKKKRSRALLIENGRYHSVTDRGKRKS